MKIITSIATILLLAGCAAQPSAAYRDYQSYVETSRPKAERGEMKWSEYYDGLYRAANNSGAPGHVLNNYNHAIRLSLAYEGGTMTKDEFQFQIRALQADSKSKQQADSDAAQVAQQQRQAVAAQQITASAQLLQQSMQPQPYHLTPAPQPVYSPTAGSPLKSTTYANGLRYCHYFNGVVNTISNSHNCPNTSP